MENRFEHLPPEEQQGWGAYVNPPPLPGQQHNQPSNQSLSSSLCARVREALPALLENDGEINPQMASALYGHLSVCPGCAHELDTLQRVIQVVEALEPAELPMDFSARIMQRIQSRPAPAHAASDEAVVRPFVASSSASSADATHAETETALSTSLSAGIGKLRRETTSVVGVSLLEEQELLTQTGVRAWERLTLAGLLSTVMTVFLMTTWGGQALVANLSGVLSWLGQVGETLRRVPLLGALFAVMFSALSQVGDLLSDTYRSLGGLAARGLALDVALCAGIYYLFVLRRQRVQMRGI